LVVDHEELAIDQGSADALGFSDARAAGVVAIIQNQAGVIGPTNEAVAEVREIRKGSVSERRRDKNKMSKNS
jgi:hypothetical protein